MPRSQANVQFGVFEGLRGLDAISKLLYFRLLVDDTVNQAGIGALRITLWAEDAELTVQEVEKALQQLDEQRFVFVDQHYQQILIRTIIRRDGVAEKPNILWAAVRAAKLVRSPRLRRELAAELRKLAPKPPDKVNDAGKVTYVYPDPHACADAIDPGPPTGGGEPTPRPARNPSENPSEKSSENPAGTVPLDIDMPPLVEPNGGIEGTLPGTYAGTPGGGGGGGGVVPPPPDRSTGVSSVADAHAGAGALARASRARVRRDRHPLTLAANARSLQAYRIVERWSATQTPPPVRRLREQLGTEVDEHLRQGWTVEQLEGVLALWGTKPLGPGAFASVAHEWSQRQRTGSTSGRIARSDANVAALDALRRPDPADGLPPAGLRAIEGA